ncbi:MAG: flagellar basal body-associated FliL family protein [Pseudomonadales bacterium]|jgi:flagellar FliL protein
MKIKILLMFLLAQLLVLPAQAEEEAEETPEIRYLEIKPAIVTNFGGPGRMKYIKAEVSLQVDSHEEWQAITHHILALRHTLVMLLSRQTDATIAAGEAKEQLRQTALAELQAVMEAEEGEPMIDDLLFSSFFVQR